MSNGSKLLVAVLTVASLAPSADASSLRGSWIHALKQCQIALYGHEQVYKYLPTDIADATGKPILSWRVALLPYLDGDALYRKIQLAEPWDSPANAGILNHKDTRNPYQNHTYLDLRKTNIVMPRGPGTYWDDGRRRTFKSFKGDPAKTILLIEMEERLAPFWTEPRDLTYDPARPHAGLSRGWTFGFFRERCCYALMADGNIAVVFESLNDQHLRSLFSGKDADSLTWSHSVWEAMTNAPTAGLLIPTLIISVIAAIGAFVVGFRICSNRFVTPGETLWLILGAQQLVFLFFLLANYEYELVPTWIRERDPFYLGLLFYPRLTACAVCFFLLAWSRFKQRRWSGYFVACLFLYSLTAVDAFHGHQYRTPEECLVVIGAPFVLAFCAATAVAKTSFDEYSEFPTRLWAHRSGIGAALVPFVWFCFWWFAGDVEPRQWFMRIME